MKIFVDKQKKLREFITRRHAKNVKGSNSSGRKMLTDGNLDLYKGMKSAPKVKFVSRYKNVNKIFKTHKSKEKTY